MGTVAPPDALLVLACAVVGLAVGSFLNVVIHRLPRMMEAEWAAQCAELEGRPAPPAQRLNLWLPPSHCPSCQARLPLRHNIPLASWLLLRGRCGFCGAAISARYPAVEALTALVSALVGWHFGWQPATAAALALAWVLIALAFIDAATTLLPDELTQPLLWLGLLANLAGLFVPLPEAVVGAVAGYLSLWSIYWVFRFATGKEGMGHGDFKLLAALGAWFGWRMLLPVVLLSSLVGALVGVALIVLRRHGRDVPIPFGPYLAAAGVLALFCGPALLSLLRLA